MSESLREKVFSMAIVPVDKKKERFEALNEELDMKLKQEMMNMSETIDLIVSDCNLSTQEKNKFIEIKQRFTSSIAFGEIL